MTEPEWVACQDPEKMLLFIRDKVSDRKMRLFALACCQRIWDRITDPRSRAAVEFAERFVEVGVVRRKGRPAVAKAASQACREADDASYQSRNQPGCAARMATGNALHAALATVEGDAWFAAHLASGFAANVIALEWARDNNVSQPVFDPAAKEPELREQVPLFRDIFPNPFRPLPCISPDLLAWGNGEVTRFARSIYEESAFDRLPILADALEDAEAPGELVVHLRSPGPHVRGCWPVDLCLGLS